MNISQFIVSPIAAIQELMNKSYEAWQKTLELENEQKVAQTKSSANVSLFLADSTEKATLADARSTRMGAIGAMVGSGISGLAVGGSYFKGRSSYKATSNELQQKIDTATEYKSAVEDALSKPQNIEVKSETTPNRIILAEEDEAQPQVETNKEISKKTRSLQNEILEKRNLSDPADTKNELGKLEKSEKEAIDTMGRPQQKALRAKATKLIHDLEQEKRELEQNRNTNMNSSLQLSQVAGQTVNGITQWQQAKALEAKAREQKNASIATQVMDNIKNAISQITANAQQAQKAMGDLSSVISSAIAANRPI
jgi:hypothetical protein